MHTIFSKVIISFLIYATLACGRVPVDSKLMVGNDFSPTFIKSCANCHGSQGEGDVGPALRLLDFVSFSSKVRAGGRGMPKFDLATYSDESLKADFQRLTGKAAP
jgi:hypothetical protein